MSDLTRRQLLKLGAAGAGATALTPLANPLGFDLRLAKKRQTEFRIAGAKEVKSLCPYCAVGCALIAYTKQGADGKTQLIQIEGDPDSPISRGRLCPKGSASKQLVTSPGRLTRVRYRRPHGTEWEDLPLEQAMDMIADRVLATRAATWQDHDAEGRRVNRTLGMASLGGATLDNEENYLIKKLFTALGAIQIENQARI